LLSLVVVIKLLLTADATLRKPACPSSHLQYALGSLMALVLGDARVGAGQRQAAVSRLLEELRRHAGVPGQHQGEGRARGMGHGPSS
jgi:hypothetical protein